MTCRYRIVAEQQLDQEIGRVECWLEPLALAAALFGKLCPHTTDGACTYGGCGI